MFKTTDPIFKFSNDTEIIHSLLYYDSVNDEEKKYRELLIEPFEAHKYRGDFYGLLIYKNVDPDLFLEALHLNGYTSPYDFEGLEVTIKIPRKFNLPTF